MGNNIFIKDILLNEQETNIQIIGDKISAIGANLMPSEDSEIINGKNKAVFPSFVNMHTHSPMSLFRGFGDDKPLDIWLNEWIWPNEKNLNDEIVYWGTKLAILEMIKSGTTCFSDMYFNETQSIKACQEMGVRACISHTVLDFFNPEVSKRERDIILQNADELLSERPLISLALSPHSIYTVSGPMLQWLSDFCLENNLLYHIHMSETLKEVSDCMNSHQCRPFEYLDSLGILEKLSNKIIAAHCLHLSSEELRLMGKYGITVVHNPNSNLKLASGHQFLYQELKEAGVNVTLGTDGCSSSNNLDMIEAMKVMALLQKGWRMNPTILPAQEVLDIATVNAYTTLGLHAGKIQEGYFADMILVDLSNLAFVPNNCTLSNLIYAAHGDCVNTVICNGKVIMRNRHVDGEEEIISQAKKMVNKLITIRP